MLKSSQIKLVWTLGPPVMRRMMLGYMIASCATVVITITTIVVRELFDLDREPWARYGPRVTGLLPLVVFLPIVWWNVRRLRREFDAARGRLCTHCAYNLSPPTMGDAGICPECGNQFNAQADAKMWKSINFTYPRR